MVFYSGTFGFLFGVLIRSFVPIPFGVLLFLGGIGIVCNVIFFLSISKHRTIFTFGVFVLFLSFGAFRFHQTDAVFKNDPLIFYTAKSIDVLVRIVEEPDVRETSVRLVTEVISLSDVPFISPSRVLVTTSLYPERNYGDIVRVKGVLVEPRNFTNDYGREFDYISYLKNKMIRFEIVRPDIVFVSHEEAPFGIGVLLRIKGFFVNLIERAFTEPESSLLGGLLVGTKQSLGKQLQDDFRTVGLVHIIVLSGYNITLVAESFIKFFSFLPRTAGLSLGAISIVLFALLTGASSTIIRASIMALIVIFGKFLRRSYSIHRALIVAAVCMCIHNPRVLVFDVSFQLSFLATLALVYGSPIVERYFRWLPEAWNVRSIVVSTLATQVFVFPYILYVMGTVSLVALPVNILVLPVIPLTMFLGFVSILGYAIFPFIFIPCVYATHILLSWILFIVDLSASFPFASLFVPPLPLFFIIFVYAVFIFYVLRYFRRTTIKPLI